MRTKPRPARLVLSRKEHWDSVGSAYATRKGLRVDKLRVLLVDDVMRPGAASDSCARAPKSVVLSGSQMVALGTPGTRGSKDKPDKPTGCSKHP
jgi:hypothetical protein